MDSVLILSSWLAALLVGFQQKKSNVLSLLFMNILGLALLVELTSALSIEGLIIGNLGVCAAVIFSGTCLQSVRLRTRFTRSSKSQWLVSQSVAAWLVSASPLLALLVLRLPDGAFLSGWLETDLHHFNRTEDNAKWLGAASAIRVGEAPGVPAVGGLLVVMLRGSLALTDLLSILQIKSVHTELGSVLDATQFVREILVVLSPLVFLLIIDKSKTYKSQIIWALPFVLVTTITQSLTMRHGFLSLQVALFAGSIWLVYCIRNARRELSERLLSLLAGSIFLLSWLPLRLFLPFFVVVSLWDNALKIPLLLRGVLAIAASFISASTFEYVLGARETASSFNPLQSFRLLEATGGVFSISGYLFGLAAVTVVGYAAVKPIDLKLPKALKAVFLYCLSIPAIDLLVTGQQGYGSTKLLFLMLYLVIVFGLAHFSRSNLESRYLQPLAVMCCVLSLFMVSSYGYALSTWSERLEKILVTTEGDNAANTMAFRVRDPLLVLTDFGKLSGELKRMRVCSDVRCDLDELPRFCLVIYNETTKVLMHGRSVTRVNALSSGGIEEYICTRFLTEISRGDVSPGALQSRFFFRTGHGLRDSLTWLARFDSKATVLVAQEGRNLLEITEVSKLAVLARKLYPEVSQCRLDFGTTDLSLNCIR